ncbi:MAG: 2-hydroxychromene-2-carboxylate isomerase [Gammaproteobacteria bacterium]|nr:2-hydroxychromene-2-carboxylate isomerase [Gammaproteobacteria bacterium]
MAKSIDYYISLNSPWSYLGHERLMEIAARHDAAVAIYPVDFTIIFPETGGLPLAERAPHRRAYRLQELNRWRHFLGRPLKIEPHYWPVDERLGAGMVIAARRAGAGACALAGALMHAVWAENRDIADSDTLLEIAATLGLDGAALLAAVERDDLDAVRAADSRDAIERGVFGAPTYLYDDHIFWGQDRLDFLDRALSADAPTL